MQKGRPARRRLCLSAPRTGRLKATGAIRFWRWSLSPVAGDPKYGDSAVNREVKKKYRTDSQLLHAWRLVMPDGLAAPLSHLSGREFTADMPESMRRMAAGMHCDKGGRFHMARKTGVEIQDFEKLSCSGTCSANGSHAGPGGRGNSAGSGSESNGSRPSERLRMKTEK